MIPDMIVPEPIRVKLTDDESSGVGEQTTKRSDTAHAFSGVAASLDIRASNDVYSAHHGDDGDEYVRVAFQRAAGWCEAAGERTEIHSRAGAGCSRYRAE
jgi:hypothetical protein